MTDKSRRKSAKARTSDARESGTTEASARSRILDQAMTLAATKGWSEVTMFDLARASGVGLAQVLEEFPNKTTVVAGVVTDVDHRVLDGWDENGWDEDATPRDRLFDLLMRRFDALAPHKEGVLAILHGGRRDPLSAAALLPSLLRSMARMLEAAGLSSDGGRGLVRTPALAAIYLSVFRVWLHDDSPDLAATMAALDKGLRRAETMARALRRRPREAASEPEPEAA